MIDLVDSTRHAREVGDAAMARLWATHDAIARDLVIDWHGFEIEKTDGIVAVFDSPEDGVAYALAYHRALKGACFPLQARAALHFAPSEVREIRVEHVAVGAKRYELDGLLKAIAARLLSLAAGGQTLVTTQVRDAVQGTPWRWHSHGHWRLKGLEEAVEVLEIRDDASAWVPLRDAEKAYRVCRVRDLWVPARDLGHNVPAERDSFVGRRRLLDDLAQRFDDGARIVSLVGIGGAGKTRVAIRHAWQHLGEYGGGVWFCDLGQARSFDGVCHCTAQGLGIALTDGDPPAQLGRAISGRGHCLVIFDNFEQVVGHAEATLGRWLEYAPRATFLVTTRETLGIRGEEVLSLPPMLPDEGVDLFLRRAKAVRQTYSPNSRELDAVAQLVRGLDGLPLALELAAARVPLLSAASMLANLHSRFDWLWARAGRRDRQATLRATFDWSWDLLRENEKAALGYLSVFEGGFTLEAAKAVLHAGKSDEGQVSFAIESLLAKSLVGFGSESRFQLLESVREYAHQQLAEPCSFEGSGPLGEARARERHWVYFGQLDEGAAAMAKADASNLVAAARRAISAGATQAAARCARSAWALLLLAGPFRVGVSLADSLLAMPNLSPREQAVGHWIAGSAQELLGDVGQARTHFLAGLECLTTAPDAEIEGRLLTALGARQYIDGELLDAARSLEVAERCAIAAGDKRLQVLISINHGKRLDHQGRLSDARVHYEVALALARQIRDRRLEGGILGNLGGICHDLGQLTQARALYRQSVDIAREVGDLRWEGNGLCNLGLLCQEQGDWVDAREALERSETIARAIGHATLEYTVLCNLGLLAESQGRRVDATSAFRQSVEAAHLAGDRRAEGQFLGYLAIALAYSGDFDGAANCLGAGDEKLTEMADRLSLAVLACQRAEVYALSGKLDAAASLLETTRAVAQQLGAGPDSELARRFSQAESALAVAGKDGGGV